MPSLFLLAGRRVGHPNPLAIGLATFAVTVALILVRTTTGVA